MSEKRGYIQRLILLSAILVSFSFAQKGAVTLGFNWEVFSRGGLTVGYNFLDDFAVELHAGGLPHIFTGGLSLKYQPLDANSYFISGIAVLLTNSHQSDSLSNTIFWENTFLGVNTGYGYEVNIKDNRWKIPIEGGVFLPVWVMRRKWTAVRASEMWVQKDEEVGKGWFSIPIPFLGFGIIWYSRTE
ncbi:MAG: hypothetical protein WBB37_08110 [bacterium]